MADIKEDCLAMPGKQLLRQNNDSKLGLFELCKL